jgi:hypothetical protein
MASYALEQSWLVSPSQKTVEYNDSVQLDETENAILTVGGGISGLYLFDKYIKKNKAAGERMYNIFRLKAMDDSLAHANMGTSFRKTKNETMSSAAIVQNTARSAEEISPLHILRTFQVSHTMNPFVLRDEVKDFQIHGPQVLQQEEYYRALLEKEGKRRLTQQDLLEGVYFKEGKMYGGKKGLINQKDILLEYAGVSHSEYQVGEFGATNKAVAKNRILEKFMNRLGLDNQSFYRTVKDEQVDKRVIVGGKSAKRFASEWAKSYAMYSGEFFYKIGDNPFSFMSEMMEPVFGAPKKDSTLGKLLGGLSRFGLGPGGEYTRGTRETLGVITKKGVAKTIGGMFAYTALNEVVKTIAPGTSAFSQGIFQGISTMFANAHIKYSELISDPLQGYKKEQEEIAPGSTKSTMSWAMVGAGAMAGGYASYGKRVFDVITKGYEASASIAAVEHKVSSINLGEFGKATGRAGRFTMRGALIGALMALPILPGSLIGDDSESVKRQYSGEELVGIRDKRYWSSGGNPWEGGKIKYYRPNWYASFMNDSKDKTLYGSSDEADKYNPFLHPIDYLANPYASEEKTKDIAPYPIWGLDISFGGAIGEVVERTIGQVIKPDVINPEIYKYTASGGTMGSDMPGDITTGVISNIITDVARTPRGIMMGSSIQDISVEQEVNSYQASLIAQGKMLPQEPASYSPITEGIHAMHRSIVDAVGLRGFASNAILESMGINAHPKDLVLARSGEKDTIARAITDLELGGLFGLGEAQRRIINTDAHSTYDRINPIKNQMPSWLPSSDVEYFENFSTGNPYQKVKDGYERLPGRGYEELHPVVKGVNAEDYPDIEKYRVLADVAIGSTEYYEQKQKMYSRFSSGSMSDSEISEFRDIEEMLSQRSIKKQFTERRTEDQLSKLGPIGSVLGTIWDGISHNLEAPFEPLLFFRPASKFAHIRSATEDYEKAQYLSTDMAIWTSPYSNFIKPAFNRTFYTSGAPDETVQKREIEEYFDSFKYVKERVLANSGIEGIDSNISRQRSKRTMVSASNSGMYTGSDMINAYSSMSEGEKAYFPAFSMETRDDERDKILSMVPDRIGKIYKDVWSNMDYLNDNSGEFESAEEALTYKKQQDDKELQSEYNSEYRDYSSMKNGYDGDFRQYLSDVEAIGDVSAKTGIPTGKFVGWDPRIDVKDIKLRTLQLGDKDPREFELWESDEERLARLVAVRNETEVVRQTTRIQQDIKAERISKNIIENLLFKNNFAAESIDYAPSRDNEVVIRNSGETRRIKQ